PRTKAREATLVAVRRRTIAGGAGLPVRDLPRPTEPLLSDGRSRGGPRRREPASVPRGGQGIRGELPDPRSDAPETHDGDGRRPLRRVHGAGRGLPGNLSASGRRRRRLGPLVKGRVPIELVALPLFVLAVV